MTKQNTGIASLFYDFLLCIGLMIISPLIVFSLDFSVTFDGDTSWYKNLFLCSLIASIFFYMLRGHFNLKATVPQIFITAFLSFLTLIAWANPALLLYWPVFSPAILCRYLLCVVLTPVTFVATKHISDVLFTKLKAAPREKL